MSEPEPAEEAVTVDGFELARQLGEAIADLATTEDGRTLLLQLRTQMSPSIMDATYKQIEAGAFRAAFALRAYERTVERYPWPPDCATYGEYFRTLPEDVREAAAADWCRAGLS